MQERYSIHTASLIASEADVETLESYEDRIHHYKNLNYTYIPMPLDGQYFDTEEQWIRDINNQQYISETTHLLDVLELLQQHPFLLIDVDFNKFIVVRNSDNKPLVVKSAGKDTTLISAGEFKNSFDFGRYEFDRDEVTMYSVNDFQTMDVELEKSQQGLVTPYEERFKIITLADVNTRRMKDMLYQHIADLAANLGKRIQKGHPDSESILKYVQPHAIGRWKKDQIEGLNLHIAEYLTLIDMLNVIKSSDKGFVKSCGFESKNDVNVLSSINEVRNSVMHANRTLIHERQDIQRVLNAVNEAERIVSNME